MGPENILVLIIKTSIVILLFIYLLVGILVARQVWLMNKAIKTKLAGCLNLVAIAHIFAILTILIITIVV